MEATIALEKQRAHTLAAEYRSRGYDVIEEPSQKQLPTFLTGYHPDMLLRKAGEEEAIIVEVKSRTSLAKEPQISELARLLRSQPGWRFELVVMDIGEQLEALEDAHPFTKENILRGIREVEQLLASGFAEAALLRAWSVAEPTVRLLAEREGLKTDRSKPLHVLKQAVVNGVVSRADYNFLLQALRHRNAQAHGFIQPDFDPTLIGVLIDTTKRLLQTATLGSEGVTGSAGGADPETL
jgi:hypothetical protein